MAKATLTPGVTVRVKYHESGGKHIARPGKTFGAVGRNAKVFENLTLAQFEKEFGLTFVDSEETCVNVTKKTGGQKGYIIHRQVVLIFQVNDPKAWLGL